MTAKYGMEITAANVQGLSAAILPAKRSDTRSISLVGSGIALEQQIVFFEPTREGFKMLVLDPPSHVDVVTVIRKFAPGVYKSPDSGRSVKVAFDTIGVSEIEAGTVVYYWDGKQFQHIETSV